MTDFVPHEVPRELREFCMQLAAQGDKALPKCIVLGERRLHAYGALTLSSPTIDRYAFVST